LQDVFKAYLKAITDNLKTGDATEHTHRPALKDLLEHLAKEIIVTNEPKHRVDCGAPDMSVSRKKAYGPLTIGHIETKDVGKDLDEAEKSEQVKRYRKHLPNLVLTDYLEFRWYIDGERRLKTRLALPGSDGKLFLEKDEWEGVAELLQEFLSQEPAPVTKPKELAVRLARLTHMVRDIIIETFQRKEDSVLLRDLRNVFAKRLVPDLDLPEKTPEFADMFAQTITYGLFAARCNHKGPELFKRIGAATEIPKTNPFLRSLLDAIMGAELNEEPYAGFVDDIVQLLAHTNIKEVLSEFGMRTGRQDPVLHFYETFLAAYDPQVREKRGVYYTPEPVVSYIVRSVDHILKSELGCKDGFADSSQSPRVLILDPACGTGTFLYAVIDHIRDQVMSRRDAGMWSGYVKNHLLPRIFGFELLMAPYAVAHFKLGMQLAAQDLPELERQRWAYDFSGDERLGIYLTNTLEAVEKVSAREFHFIERKIVEEANAAAEIKKDLPIMVILGNPPYSGHSANRSWQMREGKRVLTFSGKLVQDYYYVDGEPLRERNPKWLQDDYVKFIRWAQWRIERTGAGILGFITNHAYLDNPTFRGMRQQLMKAFDEIYVLNLHGNAKKKETCPDGSKDENVFDIQQGVAISIFVTGPGKKGPAKVHYADLWGLRETNNEKGGKYGWLLNHDIINTKWKKLSPKTPFYLFVPRDTGLLSEFEKGRKISDIFETHSVGIATARDNLTIAWDAEEMWDRVREFARLGEEPARREYLLGNDVRDWKVALAQEDVRSSGPDKAKVQRILYRPFDERYTYYTGHTRGFICMPRPQVTRHMLQAENLAITVGRAGQVIGPGQWDIVFCTRHMTELNLFRRGGNNLIPLYLYPHPEKNGELFDNGAYRHINLDPDFIADMEKRLKMKFIPDAAGDLKKTFGPEDIFNYIYAVFHSPTYRKRYAEFLKIDFPRVPLTSDVKLFRKLVDLGSELVSLHLLESPNLESPTTTYPEPGSDTVEKGYPKYLEKEKSVYINSSQHFKGVPKQVWEFYIGGYQVCQKWLKDRRGRNLTYEERLHYQKVIAALSETIRIMSEIDQAIPSWPLH
jgi:predicted helicase